MVFASVTFMFLFLPLVLAVHFVLPLGLAVATNLLAMGAFKYANFLAASVNSVLVPLLNRHVGYLPVHLPIGISFFTFHAMSYVIDIYRRDAAAQRSPTNIALYIAFFPQLIAGPIIRYHDVASQLVTRTITREGFA